MGAPRPAAPDGIRPVAGPDAVGAADTAVISILPQAVPPSAAASPGRSAPAADGARRWGPDQDEREDDQPVPWFGIDGPRHGDFQEEDDPYGSSWPDGSAAPVPRGPDVADSDADDGALADEDDDDEEGDAG
ncbi:hypothetical protein [uncultured Actinomyces sp.]|jgi:hypothetical protein|uniref:hypothetical protein n=1 Tax=uncultured Actinomyces sp. TaxID=249061 RepID=UPI0025E0DA79|nr:hypothetical protein [uncultured Actinomyces sp.]